MASLCRCWEETNGVALSPGIFAEAVGSWDRKPLLHHSSPAPSLPSSPAHFLVGVPSQGAKANTAVLTVIVTCKTASQFSLLVLMYYYPRVHVKKINRPCCHVSRNACLFVLTIRMEPAAQWLLLWPGARVPTLYLWRPKTPCSDTYFRIRLTGGKPHYWETEQVPHLYYSVCLEVHTHLHMWQEVTNPSSH